MCLNSSHCQIIQILFSQQLSLSWSQGPPDHDSIGLTVAKLLQHLTGHLAAKDRGMFWLQIFEDVQVEQGGLWIHDQVEQPKEHKGVSLFWFSHKLWCQTKCATFLRSMNKKKTSCKLWTEAITKFINVWPNFQWPFSLWKGKTQRGNLHIKSSSCTSQQRGKEHHFVHWIWNCLSNPLA